jgi:hypothetical protein
MSTSTTATATARPTPAFLLTVGLLVLGVVPLPPGSLARRVRREASLLEANAADRRRSEAGYYEGILNVGGGQQDELAMRLLGKPGHWVDFHDLGVVRYRRSEVLQFELHPRIRQTAFGKPFLTNAHGLRDREYDQAKPAGVYRIVVLGASMDMGWGVAGEETYENRLEGWLNTHAQRLGLERRFEVLNFSVAAYSPVQRVEVLRRKAIAFAPDLVLYSETMLDERLLQIHLCGLLADGVDLSDHGYAELESILEQAGVSRATLATKAPGELARKEQVKARIRQAFWPLVEANFADLAAVCRDRGLPLYALVIPRAGDSDTAEERGPTVARYQAMARAQGVPLVDLSASFDEFEPSAVSIAPWDDHPNAEGHRLLFLNLAERIVDDAGLYRRIFGVEPGDRARGHAVKDDAATGTTSGR